MKILAKYFDEKLWGPLIGDGLEARWSFGCLKIRFSQIYDETKIYVINQFLMNYFIKLWNYTIMKLYKFPNHLLVNGLKKSLRNFIYPEIFIFYESILQRRFDFWCKKRILINSYSVKLTERSKTGAIFIFIFLPW